MWTGLRRAVVVGSSAFLLAATVAAGSARAQGARLLPFVQVSPGGIAAGNITLHGVALNCETGQPASRVALYDTADESLPYVEDIPLDTTIDIASVCGNRSGSAQAGFTVTFNGRLLRAEAHGLVFEAEFPDGSAAAELLQFSPDGASEAASLVIGRGPTREDPPTAQQLLWASEPPRRVILRVDENGTPAVDEDGTVTWEAN